MDDILFTNKGDIPMGMKATVSRVPATVYPFKRETPVQPLWKYTLHRAYEAFLTSAIILGGAAAAYFLIYEPIVRHLR